MGGKGEGSGDWVPPCPPSLSGMLNVFDPYSRGLYRGFRDTEYLPFYFQVYRILSILLPGIWDICYFQGY